ncbi:MAG: hypothetical protein IJ218_03895 [Alphaproteobacteria bacterium]|nr:hypothetical protein [Alphaproteobacteria bacterium]
MTYVAPNHYSSKFKLDIEKIPSKQTDRVSIGIAAWGLFCGLIFIALGAYEIVAYFLEISDEDYDFTLPENISLHQLFIIRYSFDWFILFFGMLVLGLAIRALYRRKVVYFDGSKIKLKHKSLWGKNLLKEDDLYNYSGVLFRVEYYQFGLITRNRYIIELYHKEPEKCVPLYISTNSKNVRTIWEQYAAKLKMPALFLTDHGLVSKHQDELNKTLREMSRRWHLDTQYQEENMPSSIKYNARTDKVVLKEKRTFFDVYAILAILFAVLLGSAFVITVANYDILKEFIGNIGVAAILSVCGCLAIGMLIGIFSTDVLIIKENEVILGHNLAMFRADVETLPKDEIESVDIGHNPLTDRYYLSVIAHQGGIVFGKNMPIDDLRRIRGCVIREIVK